MADFSTVNPPLNITNPSAVNGAVDHDFPRHLYAKPGMATLHGDGNYIVVKNEDEQEQKLAEGYMLNLVEPVVVEKKKRAVA